VREPLHTCCPYVLLEQAKEESHEVAVYRPRRDRGRGGLGCVHVLHALSPPAKLPLVSSFWAAEERELAVIFGKDGELAAERLS
jgi:hypothetical protein